MPEIDDARLRVRPRLLRAHDLLDSPGLDAAGQVPAAREPPGRRQDLERVAFSKHPVELEVGPGKVGLGGQAPLGVVVALPVDLAAEPRREPPVEVPHQHARIERLVGGIVGTRQGSDRPVEAEPGLARVVVGVRTAVRGLAVEGQPVRRAGVSAGDVHGARELALAPPVLHLPDPHGLPGWRLVAEPPLLVVPARQGLPQYELEDPLGQGVVAVVESHELLPAHALPVEVCDVHVARVLLLQDPRHVVPHRLLPPDDLLLFGQVVLRDVAVCAGRQGGREGGRERWFYFDRRANE